MRRHPAASRSSRPTGGRSPLVRSVVVRGAVALGSAAVLLAAVGLGAVDASAAPSGGLVVSEVYGGGGNSGSTYTNDFVEIANRGITAVDLGGYSVQYHPRSATGTWQETPLSGTVAPGATYLVQEAEGSGGTTALPAADATGTIAMSATDGTVALVVGTAPLTCADQAGCDAATVDLVGFGGAAIADGSPVTGAGNTTSVARTAGPDTDANSTDFTAGPPTPATADGPVDPTPTPTPTPGTVRIHDIQGDGFVSPLDGQPVSGVPGVVTAVRTSGTRGYFVQDPAPDADPATSEGVFVYSGTGVAVGDSVLVSGTVSDFYPDGPPATAQDLSVTEISRPTTFVVSHGNPLPAAEVITPATLPAAYAPDLGGANIETTPVTPSRSALDFWESREGMRVEVDDARVVGPTDAYGEQYVTTKPTQKPTYRGGTLLTAENALPSGRIQVVPVVPNVPVSVGDVYRGATTGPVDYSQFGGYLIAATALGTVDTTREVKPVVATPGTAREFSAATYNVENLAPGDPATKFAALARGIVTNLAAPDVVALEEVQDDTGATDDGTTAAGTTVAKLTAAITAAGGPAYSSRSIDPADDQDGGQPGGNIRIVYLFNPARVSFLDRGAPGVDRTTTATAVTGPFGRPDLTLSPGRIAPADPAWTSSRKPLVGEFLFQGRRVFVVANHFNSKGGDGSADGRFQFPTRSSELQRQQQATLVHRFVQSLLVRDPLAQAVVLGDLNDYQFSPALAVLRTGRADGRGLPLLTDLITTLPADQQYTYVFDGTSQVLDHILVTPGTYLTGRVGYQVVHINSEFAGQTSDHDPQVVRLFGAYRR